VGSFESTKNEVSNILFLTSSSSFTMPTTVTTNAQLPSTFVDAHHHFIDTKNNSFQSFLGSLVPNEIYLSPNYQSDVVKVLAANGVTLVGTVHVECMPDDGVLEVEWLESHEDSPIMAMVGSCDLVSDQVESNLQSLVQASSKVKGIRWILDSTGPYEPNTATHVGTTRHEGIVKDYLRGANGDAIPEFERGFALLQKFNLSFDLQCAPVQLPAAARLCAKYPNTPVCIDHLGKPRMVLGPDEPTNINVIPNQVEMDLWREGMTAMAALPQVYVKLSMIGYAVPGWISSPDKRKVAKDLCREVVALFGPQRCMVGLNWWKDAATSDADGNSEVGPTPTEMLQSLSNWFADYSAEDREYLFCKTARVFYKF
jgi:predicted TIM-barrel fold metal-dependent hydrolase